MADIKKILADVLAKAKAEKAQEDETRRQKNDADRTDILKNVGGDLSKSLQSVLPELMKSAQVNEEGIRKALTEAIQINMPGIEMPEIPDIHIDTSELSAIASRIEQAIASLNLKEPQVHISPQNIEFPEKFNVQMPDIHKLKPMPVMMMDDKGRPFQFPSSNIGGGKTDFLTIKDIRTSTGGSLIDNDGFLKVTGSFSVSTGNNSTQAIDSSGNVYSQANPLPVVFSATASTASSIIDSSGIGYSGSNPFPVTIVSGAGVTSATNIVDSSGVAYSGSNPLPITGPVVVSSVTATVATANVDSSGIQYSGSNPFPFTIITNATATVNTVIVDSSGIGFNGTNPLPITVVSGALTSTLIVGDSAARTADNGGNPVKVGGIARQTNQTAFADGDRTNISTDDLGRQVTRPIQVRDLLATAYTTVSTGTETTILTAGAGTFLDCIWMMFANTSGVAQQVDIRCTSAGNIIHSVMIPASATVGWVPPIPWPQDATGNAWTVDGPDNTNSSILVTSLFTKEV